MTRPPKCALCRKPATGLASINGERYCHGDHDAEPTCYMRALMSSSWLVGAVTL